MPLARLGLINNERPVHRAGPALLCRGWTRPGCLRIPGSFGRSAWKLNLPRGAVFMNHEHTTRPTPVFMNKKKMQFEFSPTDLGMWGQTTRTQTTHANSRRRSVRWVTAKAKAPRKSIFGI